MPQLLWHVRNVVVVVDDVGLMTVLRPPVVTPRDPSVDTRDLLLLLLLLVWILLYLGHRVDPPVVEGFEVTAAGERRLEMLSLAHPGWQSVVRVRDWAGLVVTSRLGGVGLGRHVSWQSVEVLAKLVVVGVGLVRLVRLVWLGRAGVSQVAGAGS